MKHKSRKGFLGWLVVFWLVFFIAQAVVLYFEPSVFESRVVIEPTLNHGDGYLAEVEEGIEIIPESDSWNDLETHIELLQSRDVAGLIVRNLGLTDRWSVPEDEATDQIMSQLTVGPVEDAAALILVRVRDREPELAAKIASEVASAYRSIRHERWNAPYQRQQGIAVTEIRKLREQLRNASADSEERARLTAAIGKAINAEERGLLRAKMPFEPLRIHEQPTPNFTPVSPDVPRRLQLGAWLAVGVAVLLTMSLARSSRTRRTDHSVPLMSYLQALRSCVPFGMVFLLLFFGWQIMIHSTKPETYAANIEIEPLQLPGEESLGDMDKVAFLNTQREIILSAETLGLVVRHMDLVDEWEFATSSEAINKLRELVSAETLEETNAVRITAAIPLGPTSVDVANRLRHAYEYRRKLLYHTHLDKNAATIDLQIKLLNKKAEEAETNAEKNVYSELMTDLEQVHAEITALRQAPYPVLKVVEWVRTEPEPVAPKISDLFLIGGGKALLYTIGVVLLAAAFRVSLEGSRRIEDENSPEQSGPATSDAPDLVPADPY